MPLNQKPTYPLSQESFYNQLTELRHRFAEMKPELEVTVRDPSMDVEGYIVVWNTGIAKEGPLGACGKGGTRILHDLDIKDVKRLARAMAEKNAAAGLPLGGAKSGLKCGVDFNLSFCPERTIEGNALEELENLLSIS